MLPHERARYAKNLGNWGSGDEVEGGNGTLLLEMTNAAFFRTMRSISSRCGAGAATSTH